MVPLNVCTKWLPKMVAQNGCPIWLPKMVAKKCFPKIISKNDVAGGSQVKGLQNNCLLIGAYIGLRGRRRNAGHWTHRILQRFVDLRAGAAELESEPRPREVGAGAGVGARTAEPEQPELGEARARAGARVLEAAWRLTDRRVNQVFQKAANQFWQPSAKRFQQQATNQFWTPKLIAARCQPVLGAGHQPGSQLSAGQSAKPPKNISEALEGGWTQGNYATQLLAVTTMGCHIHNSYVVCSEDLVGFMKLLTDPSVPS